MTYWLSQLTFDQIAIIVTGALAVFLTQSARESRRRWACWFGMAGQPFWFVAAFEAAQPGVIFVALLYTAAWGKGIWQHWIRPRVVARARARLPQRPPPPCVDAGGHKFICSDTGHVYCKFCGHRPVTCDHLFEYVFGEVELRTLECSKCRFLILESDLPVSARNALDGFGPKRDNNVVQLKRPT